MPNAIALTSEYMPRRRRAGGSDDDDLGILLAGRGRFVAASIIPLSDGRRYSGGGVIRSSSHFAAVYVLPESIRFLVVRGGGDSRASNTCRASPREHPSPDRCRRAMTNPRERSPSRSCSRRGERSQRPHLGHLFHEPLNSIPE